MKYLLLFLFIVPAYCFGQTVYPYALPPDSSVWTIAYYENNLGSNGCAPGALCYFYKDIMAGDTLIGGVHYKKVRETNHLHYVSNSGNGYFTGPPGLIYKGAVREDTIRQKVFLRLPNAASDTLLYTYHLKVGDTLPPSYLSGNNYSITVSKIDSISVGPQFYKTFHLTKKPSSWPGVADHFMQGIGGENGFLNSLLSLPEGALALYCFDKYHASGNPYDLVCQADIITGIAHAATLAEHVSVSPNPAENGSVHLFADSDLGLLYAELFNMRGQKIRSLHLSGRDFLIDLSQEGSGIYLLRLYSGKEECSFKIVVR